MKTKNLFELIQKCNVDTSRVKIVLNKRNADGTYDPELELVRYKNGDIDDNYYGHHIVAYTGKRIGSRFKPGDIIIQLVKQHGTDIYICGTVSNVTDVYKNPNFNIAGDINKWLVDIKPETGILSDILEGRKFKNNSSKKSSYDYQFKYGDEYVDGFELIDEFMTFPGKEYVNCTFKELKEYIDLPQWKSILSDVYAIYLITDNLTHKMYIGSATSEGGLYARWKTYIETGDGGNVEFIPLGKAYIEENFSYTILEEFGKNTKKQEVLKMESKWKDKLHTREFGYNKN